MELMGLKLLCRDLKWDKYVTVDIRVLIKPEFTGQNRDHGADVSLFQTDTESRANTALGGGRVETPERHKTPISQF